MLNVVLLIVSSILLARAAAALVHALAIIAKYLKLTEFTVSFILMAFITTLPENLVGINAALAKIPTLSLGNVLGSNIVNLTLIIAIPTLLSGGIAVRSIIARRDALYLLFYALLPVILLLDGTLSRIDGLILLIFYGLYIFRLLRQRTRFQELFNHLEVKSVLREAVVFIVSIIVLLISSKVLVEAAKNLAASFNIPVSLIGLFLVAVGTSLPELAFGLKAVELKHTGLVLGNVLGSVVANSTLVLAVTALIAPITIASFSLIFSAVAFLIVVLLLFEIGVYTDKKLDVQEGLILLFVYILFIITEFGLQLFLGR
ncbi:MAG: sodium:calcium antiporter [Candidatus Cloacimonetes bacterium]|nr:sodium:calcium antiporter [Candidatus Cloacimonadota bacterium]